MNIDQKNKIIIKMFGFGLWNKRFGLYCNSCGIQINYNKNPYKEKYLENKGCDKCSHLLF
jgi:hypothetical protein